MPLTTGDAAPAFDLKNANPAVGGDTVSFSDATGENGTVVLFECNHCPYVVASVGRINPLLRLPVEILALIRARIQSYYAYLWYVRQHYWCYLCIERPVFWAKWTADVWPVWKKGISPFIRSPGNPDHIDWTRTKLLYGPGF